MGARKEEEEGTAGKFLPGTESVPESEPRSGTWSGRGRSSGLESAGPALGSFGLLWLVRAGAAGGAGARTQKL